MVARLAVTILLVCAGCKGMGGLGRGFGHLAGGLAKGIGHAAPAVAKGVGRTLGTSVKVAGNVAGHIAVNVAQPVIETTIEAAAAQQVLAPDDPCYQCPLDVDCQDCVGYSGRACMPGFDPTGAATCVTNEPAN